MDEPKPTPKRPRNRYSRKKAARSPPPKLSDDDLTSLESICSDFAYEEISVETWKNSHSDLDLVVPVWIAADFAKTGGEATVSCSRSVFERRGAVPSRQAVAIKIAIPPAVGDGHRIIIASQGDQIANETGNLIVVVKVR